MIEIAPIESAHEHRSYCEIAGVSYEEEAIAFKIHLEGEKLGLCQVQFVGNAAYILTLAGFNDKITSQLLANLFLSVADFLAHVGVSSIVYPIQRESDIEIATCLGFDRVSETLYVFDFAEEDQEETDRYMGS